MKHLWKTPHKFEYLLGKRILIEDQHFYRPRPKGMRDGNIFSLFTPGGEGCPHQVLTGGYPLIPDVPPSFPTGGGYPMPGQVLGYPQLEQHSVYLLFSGLYTSCIHAGRLSCFECYVFWGNFRLLSYYKGSPPLSKILFCL